MPYHVTLNNNIQQYIVGDATSPTIELTGTDVQCLIDECRILYDYNFVPYHDDSIVGFFTDAPIDDWSSWSPSSNPYTAILYYDH